MDPLLSLGTLTTDVKHAVCEITDDEGSLGDTSGLDTRAQDVLVVGNVVWSRNAVNGVEVAARLVSARCNKKNSWKTYYLAESLSWYSRERLKHSATPASFHKTAMAWPTSGGRRSPSICDGCMKMV